MARLNLEIPDEVKRRAKIKAAQQQRTLTQVIEELLRRWLEEEERSVRRKRLALGLYTLGTSGSVSRRQIYEDLP